MIYGNKWAAVICGTCVCSSWYITDWIQMGNNAGIVCFLTISAICLLDEHEMLSGILMGVAMIKPQIVLPFYVVFLIEKKWKVIGTSAVIVTFSWFASVLITGISPMRQLSNVLNMRVAMKGNYLVYGIFDSLRYRGISTTVVLFISMAIGIICCIGATAFLKKKELPQNLFFLYMVPAVVSVFWCYKSQCDYIIWMMKPFALLSAVFGMLGVWNRVEMSYRINRIDLYVKSAYLIVTIFLIAKAVQGEHKNETNDI